MEIGTEAAQFPEKEYTNGIFVAVYAVVAFRLVKFETFIREAFILATSGGLLQQ